MSPVEIEIQDFLKTFRDAFVSVTEVSKNVGNRKNFLQDRSWAKPVLRRMEMDGILESNIFGEYRIRPKEGHTVSFKQALTDPAAQLGDTTIIVLDKAPKEEEETSQTSHTSQTSLKGNTSLFPKS